MIKRWLNAQLVSCFHHNMLRMTYNHILLLLPLWIWIEQVSRKYTCLYHCCLLLLIICMTFDPLHLCTFFTPLTSDYCYHVIKIRIKPFKRRFRPVMTSNDFKLLSFYKQFPLSPFIHFHQFSPKNRHVSLGSHGSPLTLNYICPNFCVSINEALNWANFSHFCKDWENRLRATDRLAHNTGIN